jgi:glycogen(starch) synthase
MRVLFSTDLFWPHMGGAEVFSAKLIPALQKRGYELIVVTRQDSPDLPRTDHFKGIPIHRFPILTNLTDRAAVAGLMLVRQELTQLKRTFSPDLIHIQGFSPANMLFYLSMANVCHTPILLTLINELSADGNSQEPLRQMLRSAAWVTAKAKAVLTQARQLVPELIAFSSVIHNGLEETHLVPESLPVRNPVLLCLGRLVRQKGFDIALNAFARVTRRFPNTRMIVAGDGPDRIPLERQAAELGLREFIDFIGWVAPDQVPRLINTATLVLMPSRWEGLPSVALQASMMARPVVATTVGGLPEVVIHRQTGVTVRPEDQAALAAAVVFLLEHPEEAVRMGQAGRRRVQDVFNWQRCVEAYDRLYRKLGESLTAA